MMEQRIKAHIEKLFKKIPNSEQKEQVKYEIEQNVLEKYYDLVAGGEDENEAYLSAIESIGNVEDMFKSEVQPKHKNIFLMPIAIALYILSVVPVIVLDDTSAPETLGVSLMFVLIAAATFLIILNAKMHRDNYDVDYGKSSSKASKGNKVKEQKHKRSPLQNAVCGAIWALVFAIYFLVSFFTSAWHITWIIFLIGGALDNIADAIFEAKEEKQK